MFDFDESQTRALLRRRLSALHLPPQSVQQRIDTYIEVAFELIERVEELYHLMDETDPRREELLAGCASQLDTWADTVVEEGVKDAVETSPAPPPPMPSALARGRRPLLERYFELNAYPSTADKKALAKHEGVAYRQINVWFQNRRARAKALNAPLQRQGASSSALSSLLSRTQHDAAAHEISNPHGLKSESHEYEPLWEPETHEEPVAPLSTAPYDARSKSRRHRHQPTDVDMDDLVSSFDALNIRDVGFRPLPHAPLGYAARDSITYFAPKAPLPSFVPQDMLPHAPPMTDVHVPLSPLENARKLAGIPMRKPTTTRSLASVSSSSSESLSDGSDRVPSLTFSDSSDCSSSSSSPEPSTPEELSPSPPSSAWLDLPSPTFPIIVAPRDVISHDTSSLAWREDAGAEGDDEDDSWDRAASIMSLAPSKPRRKTSKQKTAGPHSRSSRPHAAVGSARSPVPVTQLTLSNASDNAVFNGITTAVVEDGIERLPGWDELDFSNLDVDTATAGELDIQLGSWDSFTATQPASQFDFGPVTTFGSAPSAPVAEVQSEPEKEQTVDELHANTDVDGSTWATQLASGWNDAQSLVAFDNLTFSNDFTPSAFDGFIASNWNLEPELESSSTPSTLFGKTGFEAASTTQSANAKPASTYTFGANVPETTFTFGSESAQSTFKFGAPSAATTSTTTCKSTIPSTAFTFGKPAETLSTAQASSSSPFVFGKSAGTPPITQKASTPSPFTFGTPSTSTFAFSSSSTRTSTPAPASSSCAPSSSPFAFGAGSPGVFTFGIAG
ncbi:hypothetical protein EV714DRAFT_271162 [Schizophyllum commune]